MTNLMSLEMRSLVEQGGALRLWLEEVRIADPGDDEVVVRVEAAPLNPSDILLLLGPVDLSTLRLGGTAARPEIDPWSRRIAWVSSPGGLAERCRSAMKARERS